MRFENKEDLQREQDAIDWFCDKFDYEAIKLGPNDIDFMCRQMSLSRNAEADRVYVEVKGRNKKIAEAYPLPVAERKIHALACREARGAIIWACLDGYIIGSIERLTGTLRIGGRKPRQGAANDVELMVYYDRQENLNEFPF